MKSLNTLLRASLTTRRIRRAPRVGRCLLCGASLKGHFDARNAFVGCASDRKKLVARKPKEC
jgi:ribosomal protein L34E